MDKHAVFCSPKNQNITMSKFDEKQESHFVGLMKNKEYTRSI